MSSKAINKFKEKHKDERHISLIIKFLEDQYSTKKSINFSYDQAKDKALSWQELRLKKELGTKGLVKEIKKLKKDYTLKKLEDSDALISEAKKMNNCLYCLEYLDSDGIYSVRNIYDRPVCNIEIKKDKVCQIRGYANSPIAPQHLDPVLEAVYFLDPNINFRRISKHLGYKEIEDCLNLNTHFKNVKTKEIDGKKFLYTNSKLKLSSSAYYDTKVYNLMLDILSCPDYLEKFAKEMSPKDLKNNLLDNSSASSKDIVFSALKKNNFNNLDRSTRKDIAYNVLEHNDLELFNLFLKRVKHDDILFNLMYYAKTPELVDKVVSLGGDPSQADNRALRSAFRQENIDIGLIKSLLKYKSVRMECYTAYAKKEGSLLSKLFLFYKEIYGHGQWWKRRPKIEKQKDIGLLVFMTFLIFFNFYIWSL